MLIKFFKNGQGRGLGPVGYLTAREVVAYSSNRDVLRDEAGGVIMIARDPLPEVMRGSPAPTEALIDATPHQWSYRAGVLSFAPEDGPTERQQAAVMDAFESLAFAGLEPSQRDILWVRHSHEGRVELHFVTPRMELSSGRSLNIAPPGYEKAFDTLRDVLNKAHGWADPQDPERARDVVSLIEQARRGQAREVIHNWVLDRVADGKIQDRTSMLEALTEAGFQIPRAGKDYVTALDPDSGERLRLRGDVFREDWTRAAVLERALERAADPGRSDEGEPGHGRTSRRLDGLDADELQSRLRAFEQQRAEYNRGRYGQSRSRPQEDRQRLNRDHGGGPELDPAADAVRPTGDCDLSDPVHRHELRIELVLGSQGGAERPDERTSRRGDHDLPDAHRDDPSAGWLQAEPGEVSAPGRGRGLFENGASRPLEPEAGSARRTAAERADDITQFTQTEGVAPVFRSDDARSDPPFTSQENANGRRRAQRPDDRTLDGIGARIAHLRGAADASHRSLGGAVRSLGETLDRTDQRQAGRPGKLREFAAQVSGYVDDSVQQVLQQLGRFVDLAAGLVRSGPGHKAGRPAPGLDLSPLGPLSGPSAERSPLLHPHPEPSNDRSASYSR